MGLAWVFSKDKNIIQINNDKNIKLFDQNLIDVTLEAGWCVRKPKKYYLVLKVAVSNPEDRLPFIALFYLYSMVSTCKVELGKLFSLF